VAGWAPLCDAEDVAALWERTEAALRGGCGRGLSPSATPDEVRELRIVETWLAGHPSLELALDPRPTRARVEGFAARALGEPALS
jgi:hypothetical protein